MAREFELKYAARPEDLEAIFSDFRDFDTIAMETTYYDTPGGLLSAHGLTLRLRLENGRSVCTLKLPGGKDHPEFEVEDTDIHRAARTLWAQSRQEGLLEMLECGLIPVCGARFTRRAKLLQLEQGSVELALDKGVLLGGTKEMLLCEVEVELKSGSDAVAENFARELAEKYGLAPEPRSKYRRARQLAKGD